MCFTKMNNNENNNHNNNNRSTSNNNNRPQVEICGIATLCFCEDGSWFQGSITTEDDSQYAIYGTKSQRRRFAQNITPSSSSSQYSASEPTNSSSSSQYSASEPTNSSLSSQYSASEPTNSSLSSHYSTQEPTNSPAKCDCSQAVDGPGIPVTFDIKVVDCEVGEEYSLKKVHGRNGELCSFSCSSISFTTDSVYRGHKADMISKHCLGHKMAGKRTHVYRGPIQLNCEATPRNVQWVL